MRRVAAAAISEPSSAGFHEVQRIGPRSACNLQGLPLTEGRLHTDNHRDLGRHTMPPCVVAGAPPRPPVRRPRGRMKVASPPLYPAYPRRLRISTTEK